MTDLQNKTEAELLTAITEKREELRKLRFGTAGSGMRNTRVIRTLRRDIARTLTELGARTRKEA